VPSRWFRFDSPQRRYDQLARRALNLLLGLITLAVGAVLFWIPIVSPSRTLTPVLAECMVSFIGAFICLFSVGLIWQSLRGQPTHHSFFIGWLVKIGSNTNPAQVFGVLLALALGALAFALSIGHTTEVLFDAKLLCVWLALHLQILFHEYGHCAAARACRYRPYRVVGGAFAFRRNEAGRWTIRPNRDWQFLLGGAVFYHVSYRIRTRARDVAVIAAGPLATAALWLGFSELVPFVSGVPVLDDFVAINVSMSLPLLIFNLLPFRQSTAAVRTDGYRLLELWRSG
jgi:hypothetical protein